MPRKPYKMLSKAPRHYKKKGKKTEAVIIKERDTPARFIPYGVHRVHICKLRYAVTPGSYLTMASADYMDDRVFRLNSIYDPDLTGAGNQPRFRDQLAELYDSYQVIGAKAKFTVYYSTGATSNATCMIALKASTAETTSTNPTDFWEARNRTIKTLTPQDPRGVLTLFFSPRKMFGISKSVPWSAMDTMQAETGSNPADPDYLSFLHIAAWNNTSTAQTLYFGGTITYVVRFFGYKLPQQS